MPQDIDPETIHVDDLPGIWSPVQWDLSEEERIQEMDKQATASLLWAVDAPEAILRLLLSECDIERAYDPPAGYDPEEQGDWNGDLLTFQFRRPIQTIKIERRQNSLYVEYKIEGLGYWAIEIEPDKVNIFRL